MDSLAYIGRQAIYDRQLRVAAYELFYRAREEDVARFDDPDAATCTVALAALLDFGLEKLAGRRDVHLNVSRGFLRSEQQLPLPPQRVVFEIPAAEPPEPGLRDAIWAAGLQGQRVALDGLRWHPAWAEIVPLVRYLKFDASALSATELEQALAQLPSGQWTLIAKNVETLGAMESCRALGFELFQGMFLCRPQTLKHASVRPGYQHTLQMLTRLRQDGATPEGLYAIAKSDPGLSFALLRHLRELNLSLLPRMESLQQAIGLLGRKRMLELVELLALARVHATGGDLIELALQRAHMCEELARRAGAPEVESYYLLGLASLFPALTGATAESLASEVAMPEPIAAALNGAPGPLGDALSCVLSWERGEVDSARFGALPPHSIRDAYMNSVARAEESVAGLEPQPS